MMQGEPGAVFDGYSAYFEMLKRRVGLPGFAALVSLPACLLLRRLRVRTTLAALAIFSLLYLASLPFLYRSSWRYLVPLIPLLALSLTGFLALFARTRTPVFALAVGLLAASTAVYPDRPVLDRILHSSYPDRSDKVELSRLLGETLRDDEVPVHVVPERPSDFFYRLTLFYGGLDRRVELLPFGEREGELRPALRGRALRGVAPATDPAWLERAFEGLSVVAKRGDFVLFTAERYREGTNGSPRTDPSSRQSQP
jgi:hypothetical protein